MRAPSRGRSPICSQRNSEPFAEVAVSGTVSLIYVPFTTLFALPSQAGQLRCLRNVAIHLEPGGFFVMDALVSDVARFMR